MSGSVIPCVGAVVIDGQGRLLMIKRGHEPGAGLWSIPGGRIEPGETDAAALAREMLEETSLSVQVGRLLGRVRTAYFSVFNLTVLFTLWRPWRWRGQAASRPRRGSVRLSMWCCSSSIGPASRP